MAERKTLTTRAEQAKDKAKVLSDESRSKSDVERAKIALSKALTVLVFSKHEMQHLLLLLE